MLIFIDVYNYIILQSLKIILNLIKDFMNINIFSLSNHSISYLKEKIQPALTNQHKVILGIAVLALSFLTVVMISCYYRVKAKKSAVKPENLDCKRSLSVENSSFLKPRRAPYVSPDKLNKGEERARKDKIKENEEPFRREVKPNNRENPNTIKRDDVRHHSDVIHKVAHQILEDLFNSCIHPNYDASKLKDFSFSIYHPEALSEVGKPKYKSKYDYKEFPKVSKQTPSLLVKFKSGAKESTIPLTTILKAIQWDKLDEKWGNITSEQWKVYAKYSLNPPSTTGRNHYLVSYTINEFEPMNLFLRQGQLKLSDIPVDAYTHDTINQVAKERLFTCLSAAGSLKKFPSVQPAVKVQRVIDSKDLPLSCLLKYKVGDIITEDSFLSTMQSRGTTNIVGDIKFNITLAHNSKGRAIETISGVKNEKECLFFPFTSFKVDRVEKGCIELSEVPSD